MRNLFKLYIRLLVFIAALCFSVIGCSKGAQLTSEKDLIAQEPVLKQDEEAFEIAEDILPDPTSEEKPPLPDGWPKPPHDFHIDGITMTTDKEEYSSNLGAITITITNEKYDIVTWVVEQSYLLQKVQDNYGPWEGASKWEDAAWYAGLKSGLDMIGSRSQGYDTYEHTNEYIVITAVLLGESKSITFSNDDFIPLIDPLPAGDYMYQTVIRGGYFSDAEEGLLNYEDERNVTSLRYCVGFKIIE